MNLLFPRNLPPFRDFFTYPFQGCSLVSEIANYSREPTYEDHKQDLNVSGEFGQAIQTL